VIEVRQSGHSDPLEFDVTIREASGQTRHRVRISRVYYQQLTGERCPPERLIEAAFRFLLEREAKEAILPRFDVRIISRYFPEFEARLPRYIAAGAAAGP
jgi:hypothetical protein